MNMNWKEYVSDDEYERRRDTAQELEKRRRFERVTGFRLKYATVYTFDCGMQEYAWPTLHQMAQP